VLFVHQPDGAVDALEPDLAAMVFQGAVPLPGAQAGQTWGRLALVELHLSDHKGWTQSEPDLAMIAADCTMLLRVPLRRDACVDSERLAAEAARGGELGWNPSPAQTDAVIDAAVGILSALAEDFFVRSGRRDGRSIPLDS
jgi:hypothetical protein